MALALFTLQKISVVSCWYCW